MREIWRRVPHDWNKKFPTFQNSLPLTALEDLSSSNYDKVSTMNKGLIFYYQLVVRGMVPEAGLEPAQAVKPEGF